MIEYWEEGNEKNRGLEGEEIDWDERRRGGG